MRSLQLTWCTTLNSSVDTVDSFGLVCCHRPCLTAIHHTDSTVARKRLTFNSQLSLEHHALLSDWVPSMLLPSVPEVSVGSLSTTYLSSGWVPFMLLSCLPEVSVGSLCPWGEVLGVIHFPQFQITNGFSGSSDMLKVKYSIFFRFRSKLIWPMRILSPLYSVAFVPVPFIKI